MSELPDLPRDRSQPAKLRASDEERDETIERLSDHAALGRLTPQELEERMGLAYQAKTRDDLASLTSDLPESSASSARPVPGRRATKWMFAMMGGGEKSGRWRIAPRLTSVAIMGGHTIDLRNVELESDDTTIIVVAVMGGTDIYVPDGVDLDVGGFAVMGGNGERGSARPAQPGAPRIKLRMYSLMGGCDVWRLPEEAKTMSLKDARKAAKRLR
jgi:hypothetical protein